MKRRFIPTLDDKFIARRMIELLHQNKNLTWIATTVAHRTIVKDSSVLLSDASWEKIFHRQTKLG